VLGKIEGPYNITTSRAWGHSCLGVKRTRVPCLAHGRMK